ncbi:MAG: protein jag [Oscillospiraceae bacterium]|nr:protein jag [Oscillospiraceae bacterium]
MTREVIKTAKTVDAALKEACLELGVELSDERVQHEIIDLPTKGFLGFGSHPAKVRVFIEENENKEEIAVQYIKEVLTAMGAENFSVNATKDGENLNIALEGEDLGFVIGRRGETIDAIQYLTGLVVNRIEGDYLRVTIDSGNFREKREKTLEGLARRLAKTVVKTGRSITLEPMNPYERRIIHSTVSTVEGATSSSIGEEPNRKVVISSTNPRKPQSRDNRGKKNFNRDNREGGNRGERRNTGDKPYRKNNNRGTKKNFERKERPVNNEVDTTPVTDVLPKSAESTPLYGKIEL